MELHLPRQTCGEPGARCTQRRWTPHLGPPVCFAEPDPAGAGAARVRLQDGTAVSPSKACVLAVGERSRLSNDRLTRVKQAKKKRKSPA